MSKDSKEYYFFWKSFNFCSQWYKSSFQDRDIVYYNAEQYMMAQKALLFKDTDTFNKIIKCDNPKDIKQLGRLVKNFDEKVWNKFKFNIVVCGNLLKFSQNKSLSEKLINTSPKYLVEASPYDKIWGIGFSQETALKNIDKWGENLLGLALMEVRTILIKNQ